MLRDVRHAARRLLRAPLFAAAVVATLAVGIGGTVAIVSVVDALLLRPLPYPDAERLVLLWQRAPASGLEEEWLSPAHFRAIRDHTDSFEELALLIGGPGLLNLDGPPEHSGYIQASSSFLRMLGAEPMLGRILTEDDDAPDAPPVVVITHSLWQRRFGSDPDIVGRTIGIETAEVPVVGVLAPGFLLDHRVFPSTDPIGRVEMINSMRMSEARFAQRFREHYNVLARLAPGIAVEAAQAELDAITPELLSETVTPHDDASRRIDIVPLLDQVVGDVRPRVWLLLAATALMFLVACANVASLFLFRLSSRQREIGICAALGAGRLRLVRRLVAESFLLSCLGALLGFSLAALALGGIRAVAAGDVPRIESVTLDTRILIAAIGLLSLTLVVSSAAPSLRATRLDPLTILRGRRGSNGLLPKRVGLAGSFVIAQLACASVLVVGTGLLSRSFGALLEVDPGFEPESRLTMRLQASPRRERAPAEVNRLFAATFEAVRAVPGVRSVATGHPLPFSDKSSWAPVEVEGYVTGPDEPTVVSDFRLVSPSYFETMGIELLEGRVFEERDYLEAAPPVAVVDRRFAARFWPGGSALGRRVRQALDRQGDDAFATIVGVVAPVRQYRLEDESRIVLYLPRMSNYRSSLVVWTRDDPAGLVESVVAALRGVEPDITVSDVRTLEARIRSAIAPERFTLALVRAFSAVAILMSLFGLFASISHGISVGTREIGIRMALGSTPAAVTRYVARHGLQVALTGVGVGLVASVLASRFLESLLFRVQPLDGSSYLGAATLLGAMTLVASWSAARRAASLHPIDALKQE